THLGSLRGGLSFIRIELREVGDWPRGGPSRLVELSVERDGALPRSRDRRRNRRRVSVPIRATRQRVRLVMRGLSRQWSTRDKPEPEKNAEVPRRAHQLSRRPL